MHSEAGVCPRRVYLHYSIVIVFLLTLKRFLLRYQVYMCSCGFVTYSYNKLDRRASMWFLVVLSKDTSTS